MSSPLDDMVLDLSAEVAEVRLDPVKVLGAVRVDVCLWVVGAAELTPEAQVVEAVR